MRRPIPAFEVPFAAALPAAAVSNEVALDRALHAWFAEVGFLSEESQRRTVHAWRIPRFVQLTTPGCRHEDGARLKCAWIAWFHQFDDEFDAAPLSRDVDAAEMFVRGFLDASARAREGQRPAASREGGLLRAFETLNHWTVRTMSEGWKRRWFDDLDDYVRSYVIETRHRAAGTILPPDELLQLKRVCMGQRSVLNLLERLVTRELSAAEQAAALPAIDIVSDITGAMNDPVSLERERARGDVHNLVLSFMHHRSFSERRAIDEVVSFVGERCRDLARAIDLVPQTFASGEQRETVGEWMKCCGQWVRGYHDWLLETGRYQHR